MSIEKYQNDCSRSIFIEIPQQNHFQWLSVVPRTRATKVIVPPQQPNLISGQCNCLIQKGHFPCDDANCPLAFAIVVSRSKANASHIGFVVPHNNTFQVANTPSKNSHTFLLKALEDVYFDDDENNE